MTTVEIVGWKKDFVSNSAWALNPKPELKKRLRQAVRGSPADIKHLYKEVLAHRPVVLQQVEDKFLASLTQILLAMGAELTVSMDKANASEVFKGYPPRTRP